MTTVLDAPTLEQHRPFGLALRHDLPTHSGTVIPAWTEVVNLGQPSGATVSRFDRNPVHLVICRSSRTSGLTDGTVLTVDARPLLVALGELEGPCQCRPDNRPCRNRS